MINDEHKVNESFDYKEEGELTDKLVAPGFGQWEKGKSENGLSPNPAGSGYTKQVNVSGYVLNDIANPEENVLYILADGRKFKYLKEHYPHFVRVDYGPNEFKVKGEHGTPVKEVTKPKVTPKVVPYPVHFLDDVKIKGKKLEDYIDSKGGVTEEEMAQYVASVLGTKLKTGYYTRNSNHDYEWQLYGVPEGYSGPAIYIGDSNDDPVIELSLYEEGNLVSLSSFSSNGVDKVNPQALVGLTHSFAELDETLQGIITDAIEAGEEGVACTEPQWVVIKALLDKSLYLYSSGFNTNMIKTYTDGIENYTFGGVYISNSAINGGETTYIHYDGESHVIYIIESEI